MRLKEIFFDCGVILDENAEKIEVKEIVIDIKDITKRCLFFDLKGKQNLNKVFEKGASFVVRLGKKNSLEKNVLSLTNPREVFALASKNFYKKACDDLKIIGITGTNGKTSTTKLVADILKNAGKSVGTIGTMGCDFLGNHIDTGFTTPDPNLLHSLFYKMKKSGVEYVVMEVSAHSIALQKLAGIMFDCLALTNITEDHLDFFETMENYAKTKISFFNKQHCKHGVVCADDESYFKVIESADIPLISYGIESPSDVFAIDIKTGFDGSSFVCNCMDEILSIKSKLCSDYNVLNTLCAITITRILGFSCEQIKRGVLCSSPEVGRFNVIRQSGINIIIDYAHTPDGLQKVLTSAKKLCERNLYVLFGCGGNRDKIKRHIMGSIATKIADYVFLTSDNPRFEDPFEIIKDIESGVANNNYEAIVDRKEAIRAALDRCEYGDTIIIAGKGGENYQDINGEKIAYSDFDEVYKYFRKNIKLVGGE